MLPGTPGDTALHNYEPRRAQQLARCSCGPPNLTYITACAHFPASGTSLCCASTLLPVPLLQQSMSAASQESGCLGSIPIWVDLRPVLPPSNSWHFLLER